MSKTTIMTHPLIQHKIGIMRMKSTSTKEFRDLVSEVAMLIYYEASRNLPLTDKEIENAARKDDGKGDRRQKTLRCANFCARDCIWRTVF